MKVVRAKPGVRLGEVDLFECSGVGEVWCGDWVGVVRIHVPYDHTKFEDVSGLNGEMQPKGDLILVTDHIKVTLEEGPSWPGGRLLDDGQSVCLWWRCKLKAGQFKHIGRSGGYRP
jgi:hypothetical protein